MLQNGGALVWYGMVWIRCGLSSGGSVSGGLLVVVLHLGVEVFDGLLGARLALGTAGTTTAACRSTGSSATALGLGAVGSSGTLGSLGTTGRRSGHLGGVDHDFDPEGLLCRWWSETGFEMETHE